MPSSRARASREGAPTPSLTERSAACAPEATCRARACRRGAFCSPWSVHRQRDGTGAGRLDGTRVREARGAPGEARHGGAGRCCIREYGFAPVERRTSCVGINGDRAMLIVRLPLCDGNDRSARDRCDRTIGWLLTPSLSPNCRRDVHVTQLRVLEREAGTGRRTVADSEAWPSA
jgi:hypothetical protein